MTTDRFTKLVGLLEELFQLDQPELDFGFYRIMHARRKQVTRFLGEDLLPQVREALDRVDDAAKESLRRDLREAEEQARALGAEDPGSMPKVRELRNRLEEAANLDAAEADVLDHLYRFFRRYYSDGDFLSKRVYNDGVYAIPYQGEEVKLHWANADQYYIKTDEYLRHYAFRLRPNGEAGGMRVRFRLRDAAEGEHGNVKPAPDAKRVFILCSEDFLREEPGEQGPELVVDFCYRPATMKDWPDAAGSARKKPPAQKDLLLLAEERILGRLAEKPALHRWVGELEGKPTKADGTTADQPRLRAHLNSYTKRNTTDYFIHKDLGGFLRRELDFFIKNEVMRLDDIEHETAPRVEQYLAKIRAIRRVAGKIIDFLAQLESFQKRLWLKKKFVVETSWLVRLDCVPDEFLPEIAANDAQRREWLELCAIDEEADSMTSPGYSEPLTVAFLKAQPSLMVDTRHFDDADALGVGRGDGNASFSARLLEAVGDLGAEPDGLLVHSENSQALSLMRERYREQIGCIYIDPPYNSPNSEILYKNQYKHSTYLAMIENRLVLSRRLSSRDGSHAVAIDKNEQNGVLRLLQLTFPGHDNVAVTVEHNRRGVQDQKFSFTHEYALFAIPQARHELNRVKRPGGAWTWSNFRNWGGESLRTDAANCFYSVRVREDEIVGFGDVLDDDQHPDGANLVGGGGTIEVFPIDSKGVERKWRYERETVEGIRHRLRPREQKGTWDIQIAKIDDQRKTVWYGPKYNAGDHGTRLLGHLNLRGSFDYPKSIHTVEDCVDAVCDHDSTVLDYFAGSGTTGHAVINLNRADGGNRRFILVEMGQHFDTVLVPRLKKVTYSPEWKDGKPAAPRTGQAAAPVRYKATAEEVERSPRLMQVLRLESFEDTLNNLRLPAGSSREPALLARADGLAENDSLPAPPHSTAPTTRPHPPPPILLPAPGISASASRCASSTSCTTPWMSRAGAARRCSTWTSSATRGATACWSSGPRSTRAAKPTSISWRPSTGSSACAFDGGTRRVAGQLTLT